MDTKTTVQVYLPALKAAARMAAQSDIRYYLNGVCVEATATETILVGCDGHRLLATRREVENSVAAPVTFIIPNEIVRVLVGGRMRIKSSVMTVPIEQRASDKGPRWAVPLYRLPGAPMLEFTSVEGKYPVWRRVVPKDMPTNDKPTQIQPRYLLDFDAAARDITHTSAFRGSAITALHDGGKSVVIRANHAHDTGFFGLIMGIDADSQVAAASKRPDWLGPPEPTNEPRDTAANVQEAP